MMPEQRDLLEHARASSDAAKVLRDNGYYGFAAARAYYAMFYVAEAFLLGEELAFSKHGAVHAAFNQHFCKTGVVPSELFHYLSGGMEARHAADYRKLKTVTKEVMEEQIAHAAEFLDWAARLIGPLPGEESSES